MTNTFSGSALAVDMGRCYAVLNTYHLHFRPGKLKCRLPRNICYEQTLDVFSRNYGQVSSHACQTFYEVFRRGLTMSEDFRSFPFLKRVLTFPNVTATFSDKLRR